jgi:hypothetical protein
LHFGHGQVSYGCMLLSSSSIENSSTSWHTEALVQCSWFKINNYSLTWPRKS